MQPTVVVLGAGYGGIAVAKALDDDTRVVLVEPRDAFEHNVATLRAVVDPTWADRIFIPYDRLLRCGRVVRDRAVRIEPPSVELQSGERLTPDFIVLATGSHYPFPAKSEVVLCAEARQRYERVHAELAGAARVLLVGAGPVGLELAGEIASVWPDKRVIVVDPAPDILREQSAGFRAEVRKQLEALGVELVLGTRPQGGPSVPAGIRKAFTVSTTGSRDLCADIWFQCYGAHPVTDYLAGTLATALTEGGFVKVGPDLRVEGNDTVFALGDITNIAESKRAKAAGRHAEVIAANIRALAIGRGELATYQPDAPAIVLPLGPSSGATEAPGLGIVGAEQTSRLKGADLNVMRFRQVLGYTASEE